MKTSLELLNERENVLRAFDASPGSAQGAQLVCQLMQDFAKQHVEAALKVAVSKLKDGYVTDQDEEDIMNCYSLEKII